MSTYRVELRGAASHTRANGTILRKGQQLVVGEQDATYYRTQAGFVITPLDSAPSASKKKRGGEKPIVSSRKKPKGSGSDGDGQEAPL